MSVVVWRCPACERVETETARWSGRNAECLGFPPHTEACEWHEATPFERYVGLDESELEILRTVLYGEGPGFGHTDVLRWRHVKVAVGFEEDE